MFSETYWLVEDAHNVDVELMFVPWEKVLNLGGEDSDDFSVHERNGTFFGWFGDFLLDLVSVIPLFPC